MSRRRRRPAGVANKAAQVAGETYAGTLYGAMMGGNRFDDVPAFDVYYLLYTKHPWVFACVDAIAMALSNEGFTVVAGRGREALDDTDPRVENVGVFVDNLFVDMTFREAAIAWAVDMLVYGVSYWRRKMAGSLLVGLERCDPRLVTPKVARDRRSIDSYAVRIDTTMANVPVDAMTSGEVVPGDEMVKFIFPGGDKLFGTGSKLERLDQTSALDWNLRKHRNAFFKNAGTPGTVLVNTEGDEDDVRAAQKAVRDRAGSDKAYLPMLLTGDWQVYSQAQAGKQEVDFVKATGITREEICAVYGVPPGKLVFVGGSLGSSGKAEDDDTFQNDCVLPLEELFYENLTTQVLHAAFNDVADLALVPKRRNRLRLDRVDAAMKVVQAGATGNEARDLIGFARITDAKFDMDAPLFLKTTGPAGVTSDEPLAVEEPTAGAPAADPTAPSVDEVGKTAAKGKALARFYG